jgi:hypothetical protein
MEAEGSEGGEGKSAGLGFKLRVDMIRCVNGTDNIRSYSSSDSFRGANIHPYPSPGIHPTLYPNPNTETGLL